jgi:hypothetical protein
MRSHRAVNAALLDLKSAATYLSENERWLRRLLEPGLVPCKRIGRNIYFNRVWLDEFIDDLPGISPRQARFNAKSPVTNQEVFTMSMQTFEEAISAAKVEDGEVAAIKQTFVEPLKELTKLKSQWDKLRPQFQNRLSLVHPRMQ